MTTKHSISWNRAAAATAAKSLQSCLTPSDPMDCSPPGYSIHGIFQARVLEWGAIAFSWNRADLLFFNLIHTVQNHEAPSKKNKTFWVFGDWPEWWATATTFRLWFYLSCLASLASLIVRAAEEFARLLFPTWQAVRWTGIIAGIWKGHWKGLTPSLQMQISLKRWRLKSPFLHS